MSPCLQRAGHTAAPLLIALGLAAPVTAQTLVDGSDAAVIMEIARGYGSALLETDDEGSPMIVGRIDGTRYVVLFYGCREVAGCTSIQLLAGWTDRDNVTLAKVNDWNMSRAFGRAYLDESGDPVLDYIINLERGITSRNLDDSFDWWRVILSDFTEMMDTVQ